MKAIEVAGTIDSKRELHLDTPLPVDGPSRVRVIILIPEEDSEQEWLQLAARNPAFDFLKEPEEDIYTPADGSPSMKGYNVQHAQPCTSRRGPARIPARGDERRRGGSA